MSWLSKRKGQRSYSKCSNILISFLNLFSYKTLFINIRAGVNNGMLARIGNREDPVQTASSEAV